MWKSSAWEKMKLLSSPDSGSNVKISFINTDYFHRDAISLIMRDQIRALSGSTRVKYDIRIFVCRSNFDDPRIVIARDPITVLRHPHFRDSQVLIFQWGFYADHFNLLFAAMPDQRSLTYFHNITPADLFEVEDRPLIVRSERQIDNLFFSDLILCNSRFSMENLIDRGLPSDRLDILCPAPMRRTATGISRDHAGLARLLYVGRFVPHKGARELLAAVARARRDTSAPFHLRMVGAFRFSDRAYLDELKSIIAADGLQGEVTILGELSDQALAAEYAKAHALIMPSYHEGFCLPVIEAFSAGCYVIAFDGGNLRYLVRDWGTVLPAGDVDALAANIVDFAKRVARPFDERRYRTKLGELAVNEYERAAQSYAVEHASLDAFKERFEDSVEKLLRMRLAHAQARTTNVPIRALSAKKELLRDAASLQDRLAKLERDFADRRKITLATRNIMGLEYASREERIALGRSTRRQSSKVA